MAFIFRTIITPLARTWKVRSRTRSLSYDLQMSRRGRLRAQAGSWTARVAAEPSPLPPVQDEVLGGRETAQAEAPPRETLDRTTPAAAAAPPEPDQTEDAPPTMTESDLVSLAQAQELEELLRSPLGKAIQRYLDLRYPHLQEYEDLILAEAGDLLHTDLGRQLLVVDPGEFVEAAVRRAIITVAEIRVGLRQAVRSRLAASLRPPQPEQAQQTGEQAAAH